MPEDLPVSLPSALVAQRPDVLQAEANQHAASAQIGIAAANRLPNVELTANIGSTALARPGVRLGHGFLGLGASLAQPIFDGGTLLHRERAAKAAYVQASEQYRSTVLTAFQNVADTLAALDQDAEALKANAAAADAAKITLDLSQRQWKAGYASYLSLLNAEQAYQQARIGLVQAQASRYADTVALFQALGGGWWRRSDLTKTADAQLSRRPRLPRVAAGRDGPPGVPALAACSPRPEAEAQASVTPTTVKLTPAQRQHIGIFTVSHAAFSKTIDAPGVVDFDNDQATSVIAPFSGPVIRILVNPGDKVAKGQPLALVQSGDFSTAVAAYSKAVSVARTNRKLADIDADLLAAQRRLARGGRAGADRCGQRRSRSRRRAQALVALGVPPGSIQALAQAGRRSARRASSARRSPARSPSGWSRPGNSCRPEPRPVSPSPTSRRSG